MTDTDADTTETDETDNELTGMMYRLSESWDSDDWPFALKRELIERLNSIAPDHYSYHLVAHEEQTRVELYEYCTENIETATEASTESDSETCLGVTECVHCREEIEDGVCPGCDGVTCWHCGEQVSPVTMDDSPTLEDVRCCPECGCVNPASEGVVTDGGETLACPECDSARVRHRHTGSSSTRDTGEDSDYVCPDCGWSGQPVERPYRRDSSKSAAGVLSEAGFDHLVTDGGLRLTFADDNPNSQLLPEIDTYSPSEGTLRVTVPSDRLEAILSVVDRQCIDLVAHPSSSQLLVGTHDVCDGCDSCDGPLRGHNDPVVNEDGSVDQICPRAYGGLVISDEVHAGGEAVHSEVHRRQLREAALECPRQALHLNVDGTHDHVIVGTPNGEWWCLPGFHPAREDEFDDSEEIVTDGGRQRVDVAHTLEVRWNDPEDTGKYHYRVLLDGEIVKETQEIPELRERLGNQRIADPGRARANAIRNELENVMLTDDYVRSRVGRTGYYDGHAPASKFDVHCPQCGQSSWITTHGPTEDDGATVHTCQSCSLSFELPLVKTDKVDGNPSDPDHTLEVRYGGGGERCESGYYHTDCIVDGEVVATSEFSAEDWRPREAAESARDAVERSLDGFVETTVERFDDE